MVSFFKNNICTVILFLSCFFCLQIFSVLSVEFEVGGDEGWLVPPSKNDDIFNDWASKTRFKVNDTLHFKYNKDSVLVVTKEEYKKCRSTHPLFFSNNGNTIFTLDRPDLFYFISGVAGHCERGLKMIIKVLEPAETPPPQSANETTTKPTSAAALDHLLPAASSSTIIIMFIISLFGALFIYI